jgi:hypothetical protein
MMKKQKTMLQAKLGSSVKKRRSQAGGDDQKDYINVNEMGQDDGISENDSIKSDYSPLKFSPYKQNSIRLNDSMLGSPQKAGNGSFMNQMAVEHKDNNLTQDQQDEL